MSYGSKTWMPWVIENKDLVMELMKTAYDAGIRTFDTANVYSGGLSEELVREFIEKYNIPREKLVIISKAFALTGSPNEPFMSQDIMSGEYLNQWGLSRKSLFESVKQSTERLGTYIDVLLVHRLDGMTPKAEIMSTLNDIVKSGQARYIGASTMKAYEFLQCQNIAEKNGWAQFIAMENRYNLMYREEEREMIPLCNDTGVGLIPYSGLASGALGRTWSENSERAQTDAGFAIFGLKTNQENKTIVDRVEAISKDRQVSMATVALAWTIQKGCSPIVGISKVERIPDIVAAVKFKLTEKEIKSLESLYTPRRYQDFRD